MIGDIRDIGREKRQVLLVDPGCYICPPQERLSQSRASVDPAFEFDIRFDGMQTDSVHALHAVYGIVIAAPDGDRAIRMLFDLRLNRHESRGPMVLRPVKLHASGNPRTSQSHQGRSYDVLPVKEIVAIGFIET